MNLGRFWRHVAMTPWQASRAFPAAVLDDLQREVGVQEKSHRGEVRFVVEAELSTGQLWANLTSRARAIELFSLLQVWDTEENTGILIYVLLADHKVEVVADRGIQALVAHAEWAAICGAMEAHFREGHFAEGARAGIQEASALLARHFPAREANANELSDRPIVI